METKSINLIYAHEICSDENLPSIFLAGPSPRDKDHYNWRPEAIEIIENSGFAGNIFIPLPRDGEWLANYNSQIEWELKHLDMATVIAFWIPRDYIKLPAYTTNVEFGLFIRTNPEKVVLGYPESAVKMKYLDYLARKYNASVFHTLEETLNKSVEIATLKMNVLV